jgi:hypothetical protein
VSLDASTVPPVRIASAANAVLVGWLREAMDRPTGRLWARRRVPVAALRCHPDLCDRLDAMAYGLPDVRTRFVGGMPVLVHDNGVAFAVAAGTSWVSLRLPPHVYSALIRSEWGRRGLEGDWVDVDPWLTDMESREGLARLRGWCRAAHDYAGELAPPPRARRPQPRRRPR